MDDGAQSSKPSGPLGEAVAWNVLAYLISGPALYGGLGWAADRWLGTSPVLAVLGILGGMVLALYLVWVRYGSQSRPPAASPDAADDE